MLYAIQNLTDSVGLSQYFNAVSVDYIICKHKGSLYEPWPVILLKYPGEGYR